MEAHGRVDCKGSLSTCSTSRGQICSLFWHGIVTVSQFIWQLDVAAIAHLVMDCFDLLHAPNDDMSDDST